MGDSEITEASITAEQSTGVSSYLHGIGYPLETFKQELNSAIKYIKSHAKVPARAAR